MGKWTGEINKGEGAARSTGKAPLLERTERSDKKSDLDTEFPKGE